MSAEQVAIERTRALLTRRLGIALELERGEPFRDAAGLAGEWFGVFAQPGVILNAATVVRATVTHEDAAGDARGESVDEYGEAVLQLKHSGDRVELHKQYKGRGGTAHFVYVGRLLDGALAGYWYSAARPSFGGVFWMARVERLAPVTRDALSTRVRTRSVRRMLLYVVLAALGGCAAIGLRGHPPIALAVVVAGILFHWVLHARIDALWRERQLWQRQLR